MKTLTNRRLPRGAGATKLIIYDNGVPLQARISRREYAPDDILAPRCISREWVEAVMRTVIDVDDAMLSLAQQQLGTRTKRETINRALAIAAGTSADDRARGLAWLREHADEVLDFDFLEEEERAGR